MFVLQQGISEPVFYADILYRFRKIIRKSNFSEQFRKLINRYKRIDYSLDIMRQTACLFVNLIIADGCVSFFNCTTKFRASDWMTTSSLNSNQWVWAWLNIVGLDRRGSAHGFHFLWLTVELVMSTRLCLFSD